MTRSMDSELDRVHIEFEQRLFASARSDEPPAGETERAWQRFAARAGALAPLAVAASTPPVWWRSARASALKWTLLGALGGGSIVAVWLRPPLSAGASHAEAVVLPGVPAGALTRAAVSPEVAPSSAAGAAPEVDATPTAPAATRAAAAASASTAAAAERHPQRRASPASPPKSARARPSSAAVSAASLAREVAALDAARSALAVGAHASVLRQIERYRRDFPAGELSADADVVAIEALAADGERAAAQRAAELFLERHPHDPHAARVRELGR